MKTWLTARKNCRLATPAFKLREALNIDARRTETARL